MVWEGSLSFHWMKHKFCFETWTTVSRYNWGLADIPAKKEQQLSPIHFRMFLGPDHDGVQGMAQLML